MSAPEAGGSAGPAAARAQHGLDRLELGLRLLLRLQQLGQHRGERAAAEGCGLEPAYALGQRLDVPLHADEQLV